MKSKICFIGLVTTRRQMTALSSMLKAPAEWTLRQCAS